VTHDDIAAALIRAHQRGAAVRVLVDKQQAGGRYADDEKLLAAGVPLLLDTKSGLMHHKFMVGDQKAVITGSFNWTKSADTRNAENFVIIRLSYAIKAFHLEFQRLWVENSP